MHRFILIFLASTVTFAAQGQVIKCTNPKTGAVTFSDVPCETGQGGVVVQQRRSDQEIRADNQRAAEANERKYQQRAAEQDKQPQFAQQERPQQQRQPDKSQSHACQQAKRDLDVVSSSVTGSEDQRRNRINASTVSVNAACGTRTEMIQPPPVMVQPGRQPARSHTVEMSHCVPGFCYDGKGGVYHRNGPDHMTGPNGSSCNRSGSNWLCN